MLGSGLFESGRIPDRNENIPILIANMARDKPAAQYFLSNHSAVAGWTIGGGTSSSTASLMRGSLQSYFQLFIMERRAIDEWWLA